MATQKLKGIEIIMQVNRLKVVLVLILWILATVAQLLLIIFIP